jgi:ribonuclease P protein component
MNENSFGRTEKLKSEKSITELFESGKSLSSPPIRLIYLFKSHIENNNVKTGFAVSKKNFRKAVDRNLIKRRMREAYRLKRGSFINEINNSSSGLVMIFVYQAKEIADYNVISNCIKELLTKLSAKTNKT